MDDALLTLIEDVIGLTDPAEFRLGLLESLNRALPSDFVSLNDLGAGPLDATVIVVPPAPQELLEAFARYKDQNPIAQHHARTRDGRAYRFSDVIGGPELRRLDLYREVYAPLGIEYQIAFTLPGSPYRLLAVALSRSDPDYSDRERDLINRARPSLIQVFRNVIELERVRGRLAARRDGRAIIAPLIASGLTEREAQVIDALAHGVSTHDIAADLQISPRTVGKHLEHCFRKLGVTTQSAAAANAWTLADDGFPATFRLVAEPGLTR